MESDLHRPSYICGVAFGDDATGPKDVELAFGHRLPRLFGQRDAGNKGYGLVGGSNGQAISGDGRAGRCTLVLQGNQARCCDLERH